MSAITWQKKEGHERVDGSLLVRRRRASIEHCATDDDADVSGFRMNV
jgi:hypothetical protein